jgi:Ser/Thr protein kinase RdoA (MazF antagonist)
MESRIKDRYSDTILQAAMGRYGIAPGQIRLLDGFESFIYEFQRGGEATILRIGHSLRRSVPLICGEVDWINYLAAGGASVARAVPSARGNLVERLEDGRGGHFLATAFVKAQGKAPRRSDWTPPWVEAYGALLGRIHRLSRGYEPPDPAWKRPAWDAPAMLEVERQLPADDVVVLERYRALIAHLGHLPRTPASYGLIHQDAHGGNLRVDGSGRITLFDFDDCVYSWYANDVAIVLFYAAMWDEDTTAFSRWFMRPFLRGYRREADLDPAWLAEIPYFLKLREIDLYAVIHRSFDVENLDDPWCARYMHGRRERIEAGVPTIDFPFESLADCLVGA